MTVLIMIPYESNVGYAIGRLIGTFRQMALRLVDDPKDIHFAFKSIDGGCPHLPADANLLAFCHKTGKDHKRLADYIWDYRIRTVVALDMKVDAPCLRAARRAGVRHVVAYWGAPMSSVVPWKWPLKRLQVALTRSKPDLFVFESEAMRRLAVRGRGVAKSATTVIRTGVDPDRFRPGPSNVHELFGIPAHRKIIVYMGHCHIRKGVPVFLEAAHCLATRDDIHFLILGNKPGEADAFRTRGGNITLGGYQNDVPSLLAGCYAGAIPSTGWDSFPMSSLEMQACGLPVIVSDLQGCPETIDAETGIVTPAWDYVALAEAIVGLVDDPEMHQRMRVAARARIERELTVRHQVDGLVAAVWSIYPPALRRAISYERACEEANERHLGMYDEDVAQARALTKQSRR